MLRASQKGISTIQLVMTLALAAMLMLVTVPAFSTMARRSRISGASRQIVSDLREARGRAVGTGWEYKVIGFAFTSTDTKKNQYRILARSTTSVTWPADASPKLSSATQLALDWVDVARLYPGVRMVSPTARFEILFNSRGTAPGAASFNPLVVNNQAGESKSVTVTTVGGVRVQ